MGSSACTQRKGPPFLADPVDTLYSKYRWDVMLGGHVPGLSLNPSSGSRPRRDHASGLTLRQGSRQGWDGIVIGRLTRRLVGALSKGLGRLGLGKVPDPRSAARVRLPLPLVLRTVMLGLVTGAKSLADTEVTSSRVSAAARQKLGLRGRIADTTMRDLLVALEPAAVRACLHEQVRAAHRQKAIAPYDFPWGVVSMDGKATAIAAWDDRFAQKQAQGGTARGLVRTVTSLLVTSGAKVCLDACPIAPSTNEDGQFIAALDDLIAAYGGLDLFRMVTYDSGACSLANATAVRERHLHYLFRLDGKQPTLFQEARRLMGHLENQDADASTVERTGRGSERRYVFISKEMAGFHDWKHLATVILVRRVITTAHGQSTADDRYYLSSLAADRLSAAQWLKLTRLRWAVENEGHHTFDTVFAEDERPWVVADPSGMLVVLLLRRMAYNLVALFRAVTQRSDDNRRTPWARLIGDWAHALTTATDSQLLGLPAPPG